MVRRTKPLNIVSVLGKRWPMQFSKILLEAIALRKHVVATYNRQIVTLAPHILYTRHDELYVDAVTVERDGKPPREIKLGTFKLTGLSDVSLVERSFLPMRIFDAKAEKYAGTTLLAVEA